MNIARTIHLGLAWLLVAGLAFQVFLAGLGVFDGEENFATHRDVGYALQALPFFMAITAWIGKLGRRHVTAALVIFVLFFLQSVFVAVRGDMPAVAALHPVNGFVIALLAVWVARDAWNLRAGRTTAPAATESRPAESPTA